MKKVKFIYNPYSGKRTILKNLDFLIKEFQESGITLIPHRIDIEAQKSIDYFNKNEKIDYEYVLISGGDGTISRVINEINEKQIDIPIAILATGTANDFGKLLGYSGDLKKDISKILAGNTKEVDLVKVNNKYFLNVLTGGVLAEVSQNTPVTLKNNIGKSAYYLYGAKEIQKLKSLNFEFLSDGKLYKENGYLFFIFNGKMAGNIEVSYKSEIDDGLVDVIIVKKANVFSTMESIFNFFKNLHLEKELEKNIIHFKASKLKITCDKECKVDIDGEKGPNLPLDIECLHKGLKVIC